MKTISTTICVVLFLFLNSTVSAQELYTQTGTDVTWQYILDNKLIPIGQESTAGIKGSIIDVNQAHTLISSSPYANRAIQNDITIHTVGNQTIARADFPKWSRWYQEDGNTQIFRMFQGEENVANAVYYKPRVESELSTHSTGTKIDNGAEWCEWSGTYTFVKPVEATIFQIWSNDDYVLMLHMRNDGSVAVNPRDGSGFRTFTPNGTGKSFNIRVRDYGTKYEVYVDGNMFFGRSYTPAYSTRKAHFRWGLYTSQSSGDHSGADQDGMMFITGAQRKFSNSASECTVHSVTNNIETENYCKQDTVITQTTTDEGGGLNVTEVNPADWMEYKVYFPTVGDYELSYRLASNSDSIKLTMTMNGNVLDSLNRAATGGNQTWTTIKKKITIDSAGEKTIRLIARSGGWNINWIRFTRIIGPQSPVASIVLPTLPVCPNTPLSVTVNGADSDGTVKSVELIVNGVSKGVQNSSSYTYDLGTGTAGDTFALEAKVNDNTDMIGVKTSSFKVETDCSAPIKLTACAATASIVQSPNNAENVFDGNSSTRWAGLGLGATLTVDLCSEVSFNKIKMSFYSGTTRIYKFDLQASNDNINFSTFATDFASNGTTADMEEFTFTTQKARYIRYVGQGNTANLWNSIYEMEILAKVGEDANSISIINDSKNRIKISPNPARNEFYINTKGITAKQISIKNAVGMEVLSKAFGSPVNDKYVVNKNLKTGIYFVFITDNINKIYSEKLVIQ